VKGIHNSAVSKRITFIDKMLEAHGTRKHGEASLNMHNRKMQYIYYVAEYRYLRRQRKH
jgi:hypothetical protein